MLTERQQSILEEFLQNPDRALSIGDLLPVFNVGRTSLFRDLSAMVEADLLLPDAPTRARTYRLNPDSAAYLRWDLSRPPQQRPEVRYNPRLLAAYRPNHSFLLTSDQRTLLRQAGNIAGAEQLEPGKDYTRLISTLLIDLAHASSNLENVPISWLDTKTLIEFGERPDGLDETQLRIVLNHKAAINHLTTHAGEMNLCRRDLFDLHALIAEGLIAETAAIGTLRNRVVRFSDSRYLPPDNPHLLKESFDEFCDKASLITDPYEQAFFTMTFVPYLQPFQDGNKRTSRLGMNIPLLKNHLAPFSFSDLRKRDYMFGLLAFYERGQHAFLAEAFVAAYQKTAPRYATLLDYIQQGGVLGTLT
ncbi:Fic family protein [Candidatus Thiothrix anitrata]|uniref:Fic family protein n=1 Tax=Candidatus Thiothrix anitrata TaxID=2823902 RepID=A0ABX7X562_9GAMM|nr:Fic family protein [Candidatus Thiothrix anitrata]QTR51022.1 Fic family protein [Candidatus Thiothrix anitrata]